MTVLEFICAQAPLKMKGLLIGLWYATTSLQIHNNDSLVPQDSQFGMYHSWNQVWYLHHSTHQLLVYCCVAKWYRYRVRDVSC